MPVYLVLCIPQKPPQVAGFPQASPFLGPVLRMEGQPFNTAAEPATAGASSGVDPRALGAGSASVVGGALTAVRPFFGGGASAVDLAVYGILVPFH